MHKSSTVKWLCSSGSHDSAATPSFKHDQQKVSALIIGKRLQSLKASHQSLIWTTNVP